MQPYITSLALHNFLLISPTTLYLKSPPNQINSIQHDANRTESHGNLRLERIGIDEAGHGTRNRQTDAGADGRRHEEELPRKGHRPLREPSKCVFDARIYSERHVGIKLTISGRKHEQAR